MTLDYNKLENIMVKKCITPYSLSEKSGVSYKTLYNYKNGLTKKHSIKTIGKLARALNVNPSEITS